MISATAVLNFFFKKVIAVFLTVVIVIFLLFLNNSFAQSSGDFRTSGSGSWSNVGLWQQYNGTSWIGAGAFPTGGTAGTISILNGHSMDLNVNITLDQLVINLGGTINILAGDSLNITHSSSADFSSFGTVTGAGNIYLGANSVSSIGAGTITGSGNINISPTAYLAFTSVSTMNRSISNNGIISWSVGGNITGTGTIDNNGVFKDSTTANYSFAINVNNNNTFNKYIAASTNSFLGGFTNKGSVNIIAGGISLAAVSGTYTHTGTFAVSSGATLQIGNLNSVLHNIQSSITGSGNVIFSAKVKLAISSTYNISGTSTFSSDTTTFNTGMTLTNLGNININGGTLNLTPGIVVGSYGANFTISAGIAMLNTGNTTFTFANFNSTGGTVQGSDTVKVASVFNTTNGTYSGSGGMTLLAGCLSTWNYSVINMNRNLINNGTITCLGGNLNGTGIITNNNIFNFQATNSTNFIAPCINNGTFTKSASNITVQISGAFTNNGALNVNSGLLTLQVISGTFTHLGTFTVASGATLEFGSTNTAVHNIQSSISGAGIVIFAAPVKFAASSTYNVSGTSNFAGDTVSFSAGMNLTNLGSISGTGGIVNFNPGLVVGSYNPIVNLTGGTLNFNTGTSSYTFTTLTSSGSITGADTIKISGTFNCSGGSYTGAGPIVMQAGCNTNITIANLNIDKNFINNGTLLWTSGQFFGTGTFINNNIFNIQTSLGYTMAMIFINNGTITKSATNNRNYFNLGFTNSGTVNLNIGTLSFIASTGNYTHTGSFHVASGALMEFGNSSTATHNFQSSINGAGNVNFVTNSNFTATSTYNISGNTVFILGTVNFTGGMTLTNLGTFSSIGGTASFNSGLTISSYNPAISISGGGTMNFSTGTTITLSTVNLDGTISGSDTVQISNSFNMNSGTISGTGPFIILASATMAIAHTDIFCSKLLINNGIINWSVGAIGGTGSITNNNLFNIICTSGYNCNINVTNNGTMVKNSLMTNAFTLNLNTTSIVNILLGTLQFNTGSNSGAINLSANTTLNINSIFDSPSSITIPSTATITGAGTLNYNSSSLINNGTISLFKIQFGSTTNLSGSGVFTTLNCIVLNGGNVMLGSNHQFQILIINTGGIFNNSAYTLFMNGGNIPLVNNGTFTASSGTVEYNGTSLQNIATAGMTYNNISINNSAGVSLLNKISIPGTVFLTNGNLTLTDTLVMGNSSTLNRKAGSVSGNLRLNSTVNVVYSGVANVTSGIEIPNNGTINKLTISNPAGINLNSPFTMNDTLFVLAGFLNLNGKIITLSTTGYLSETAGNTVKGATGSITTTRTLSAPSNLNIGGMGAVLTSAANLGVTTITRSHTIQVVNGGNSIARFFDITPANNSGLNASIVFKYDNTELNGLNENTLSLYKSTNSGTSWNIQGGTRDTTNNTISLSGINSFSRWTAASNSLATNINITVIPDGIYNSGTNSLNFRDTVTVYLANSTAPYAFIDSSKFTLDSISFSGVAQYNSTPSGTYYIVVKHRNSLTTWSKAGGETYTSGAVLSYNFTSAISQAFGSNMNLRNGKYTMISGDVNQDGFVNGNDFTIFSQQFGQSGYISSDLNSDGTVNGNDFTIFSSSFGKAVQHP